MRDFEGQQQELGKERVGENMLLQTLHCSFIIKETSNAKAAALRHKLLKNVRYGTSTSIWHVIGSNHVILMIKVSQSELKPYHKMN